ncbi:MAG: hypothetical protein AAB676_17375, partial [Verrucomicrobiota bacterium]
MKISSTVLRGSKVLFPPIRRAYGGFKKEALVWAVAVERRFLIGLRLPQAAGPMLGVSQAIEGEVIIT